MSYNIVQKTTPNKSDRKGWKPDMIISHITEGSYNGAVSWLMNPKSKASSHFVVSKTGHITQLGLITEITHSFGKSGFSTSFTVDSGGSLGRGRLSDYIRMIGNERDTAGSVWYEDIPAE